MKKLFIALGILTVITIFVLLLSLENRITYLEGMHAGMGRIKINEKK